MKSPSTCGFSNEDEEDLVNEWLDENSDMAAPRDLRAHVF